MSEPCREWRADLAALALDRLTADQALRVRAHAEICPACRAELRELQVTAAAMAHAELDHIDHEAHPPTELRDRVAAAVRAERRASVSRARRWIAAAAAALMLLGAGSVALLRAARDEPPAPRELAFDFRVGNAWGNFMLDDDPQGTRISLDYGGLEYKRKYWLWVTDGSGKRTSAGSFWGAGGPKSLVLHAALDRDDVERVWVTDEADQVVLDKQLS